jgi:hypothetical protein
MRYTGEKYTDAQAAAIMEEARASTAGARASILQWRAEDTRRRDGADTFVTKTIDNARVADAPVQQTTMDAQTASWVEWVDARIEAKTSAVLEIVNQVLGQMFDAQHDRIQEALDRKGAQIEDLRRELEIKLGLKAKVARLKSEISEARQQAPNFKAELARLQEQVEKQQKTIVRLRAQNSMLEYQQKEVDRELSRIRRETAPSGAVVQFETSSSRITVGNLHPDAANALRDFASQCVDAYDGDPILFSGSAGTA